MFGCSPFSSCVFFVFQVATIFTGKEGKFVSLEETIKGFQEILNGQHDDKPEQAFYMVGNIEEVVEKAKALELESADTPKKK